MPKILRSAVSCVAAAAVALAAYAVVQGCAGARVNPGQPGGGQKDQPVYAASPGGQSAQVVQAAVANDAVVTEQLRASGVNVVDAKKVTSKAVIAIPAFRNLTGNPAFDWLGTAFSETLASKLSNVSQIRVVERSRLDEILREMELAQSGMVDDRYAQVGRMAGAQFLLVGSFQAIGEGQSALLKVSTRIVDVATGLAVEGQGASADGQFRELFGLQDRMAERAAVNLAVDLRMDIPPDEMKKLQIKDTDSVTAYELYWIALGDRDPLRRIELLRKAISFDKGYAKAYMNLASNIFQVTMLQPQASELESAIAEATRLDPLMGEAWNVAGTYYDRLSFYLQQRGEQQNAQDSARKAVADYRKFIELKGGSDSVYFKGQVARAKRRVEELSRL